MREAREATLFALGRAVLDLAGAAEPACAALRQRLDAIEPATQQLARRAMKLAGYRSPQWEKPHCSIFSLVKAEASSKPLLLWPHALGAAPRYPSSAIDPSTQSAQAHETRTALLTDLAQLQPEVESLLFLLEKYGFAVSTGEAGLAFVDVARLAAATAGALASGAEQLALVAADFSGIQAFIYTIAAKGALRGLRARSFFLTLLAEDVAQRLIEQLGLTRANLLYVGGGHIYLVSPATQAATERVQAVQIACNEWLRQETGGNLYLALGCSHPFAPEQMAPGAQGVAEIWQAASLAVASAKAARFSAEVGNPGYWAAQSVPLERCAICHRASDELELLRTPEAGEEPIMACSLCVRLDRLGQRLPHTQYIAIGAPGPGANLQMDDRGYYLCERPAEVEAVEGYRAVMVLNGLEAAAYTMSASFPVWLAQYAYRSADGQSMATFEELATASTGARLLGVLRMDVDNLGQLFRGGLPQNQHDFPRVAGLSRGLTHFFAHHLNSLCAGQYGGTEPLRLSSTDEKRPVVVVYAGGDDLFLVGAWDQLLELAFEIRRSFQRYTGGRLTLSGGMLADEVYRPLHRLAAQAHEAEEAAKENGKDSITALFIGHDQKDRAGLRRKAAALRWDEAEAILAQVVKPLLLLLNRARNAGPRLSRRFVYHLLALTDYWLRAGWLYLPRLAYLLARVDERLQKESQWKNLKIYLMTKAQIGHLSPALRWLDLLVRGGSDNE